MTDQEYLYELRKIKSMRLSKDDWHNLSDKDRVYILEKLRELSDYSVTYRARKELKKMNSKKDRMKELDPYGEENWDDDLPSKTKSEKGKHWRDVNFDRVIKPARLWD